MKKIDKIQFFSDIELYFCYLRLKEFFCNNISSNTLTNSTDMLNKNEPHLKSNNSAWTPTSGCHQTLDLYNECFRKQSHAEIMKLKKKSYDTINYKERVPNRASTIILNRSDYIKEKISSTTNKTTNHFF